MQIIRGRYVTCRWPAAVISRGVQGLSQSFSCARFSALKFRWPRLQRWCGRLMDNRWNAQLAAPRMTPYAAAASLKPDLLASDTSLKCRRRRSTWTWQSDWNDISVGGGMTLDSDHRRWGVRTTDWIGLLYIPCCIRAKNSKAEARPLNDNDHWLCACRQSFCSAFCMPCAFNIAV